MLALLAFVLLLGGPVPPAPQGPPHAGYWHWQCTVIAGSPGLLYVGVPPVVRVGNWQAVGELAGLRRGVYWCYPAEPRARIEPLFTVRP